jgi:curli biogenesis system outer membrane secretion channel CsgG
MNNKTRDNRGLWDAGALAVAAAVTVLATACGDTSSAPSAASTAAAYTQQTLAQCMRGHGVPGFPGPNGTGSYTLTASRSLKGAGGSSIDIGRLPNCGSTSSACGATAGRPRQR